MRRSAVRDLENQIWGVMRMERSKCFRLVCIIFSRYVLWFSIKTPWIDMLLETAICFPRRLRILSIILSVLATAFVKCGKQRLLDSFFLRLR